MRGPLELEAKEEVFPNRTIDIRSIQHPVIHHGSSNAVVKQWTEVLRGFGHRIFSAVI